MKKCHIGILLALVFLSSCTLEKRLYRPGFYVNRNSPNSSGDSKTSFDSDPNPIITEIIPEPKPATVSQTVDKLNITQPIETVGFTKSSSISKDQPRSNPDLVSDPPTTENNKRTKEFAIPPNRSSNPGDGISASTMITLGWVFTGVAIISLFAFWPLIFFLIPGLIFLLVGYNKKKSGDTGGKKKSEELQDVVYLKNGSIIRGIIIEQVPNVSIKIQTGDGSVFFYKMEEIEKITKEPKP